MRRVEFISPTKLVTDISASYYKLKSVEILKTLFRGAKTELRCFNINISLKIFPTQFYLGTFWIRAPFSHFMNIFREVPYSLLPCWYVEYKIRKLNYDKFDIIVRVHQLSPVFFSRLFQFTCTHSNVTCFITFALTQYCNEYSFIHVNFTLTSWNWNWIFYSGFPQTNLFATKHSRTDTGLNCFQILFNFK